MEGGQNEVKPLFVPIDVRKDLYGLIGGVSSVLETAGLKDQSDEFVGRAVLAATYDEVLELSQDYVQFRNGESNEPETHRNP